jgi:hypothetical protein
MRKAGCLCLKGKIAGPKPSEEIVIRISDLKKTTLEVQELVKKFGGEMLNAEGNMLLISLPSPVFQEFRKELEKARAREKESGGSPGRTPEGASFDVRKKEGGRRKDKELNRLAAAMVSVPSSRIGVLREE